MENILPSKLRIPPPQNQNILMQIAAIPSCSSQHHRRPGSIPDDFKLHAATDWFRHAVYAAQRFHFHGVLGFAPC